jgi:hypothetical protein
VKDRLEEIGIAALTDKQLEQLCETGERAARAYILSKVPRKHISTLDITIDIEGSKPVTVNVEVELELSESMKDFNVDELAKQATQKAFEAAKLYLRGLSCKSEK